MAMSRASNAYATLLCLVSAAFICRADSSSSVVPQTKNYIDTIPGYDELSACASRVLSTIVRDENSGCQDTYALTSYTCFCTDSSSYFSNVISRDVVAGCDSSFAAPQATSALSIFDSYCALGVPVGLVPTQPSPSDPNASSASPGASAPTTTSTQTSASATIQPSATIPPSQNRSVDIGTAIGAAVGVAAGLIGLAIVVWCAWRRRYRKAKAARAQLSQSQRMTGAGYGYHQSGIKSGNATEMPTYEHHVREMQVHEPPHASQQQAQEALSYRPHELSG
ncbi:hypothetical protein KVR01_000154 [Diaporthe batatas]|uniref:uncharacterized protein n=1 Tax=Diaporthe batatas TaxID=748121 RepID=UPI001D0388A0|nr:uncharacterized protein KVR01_000154 [Diaporthe batatas]KAG8169409.1 hypothetical protein KVR01_000154 [Diaporthe batatas]